MKNKFMSGKVFVISAPSGAGKSSLVKSLCERDNNLSLSISYTTRKKRINEINGKDYHFISKEEFEIMITNNEFIEYATVYGNYYGTSLKELKIDNLKKDVILEIDWQGARQIKKIIPKAVLIFILPPDLEVLKKRLITRNTDTDDIIQKRINMAHIDINNSKDFDYTIINDNFEKAINDIHNIIERARKL